jgi:hypothetical protein
MAAITIRPSRPSRWRPGMTILLLLLPGIARGADVIDVLGRMRRAAEPGHDERAAVELVITNAQGERVHWTGQFYRLDGSEARKRLVLDSPVDLRSVSITVQRTAPGADRFRVYLPFIRRIREIDADMRGESFLGTDFNYEDLGFEEIEFHQHTLRGEEEVVGRGCYRVESVPAHSWWYGRIVRCIDRKDYLPRRTEYYDPAGMLYKIRTLDRVETIAGHPTPTELTMEVVPARTSSRIILKDVEYDTGLASELFEAP